MLNALVGAVKEMEIDCIIFLDKRFKLLETPSDRIVLKLVEPCVFNRFRSEMVLKDTVGVEDVVLSFGNLPPIFKLMGRTITFIQNRYLVDKISLDTFNLRTRLRISLERLWLSLCSKNTDLIVVQTPSMRDCILRSFGTSAVVLPFCLIERPCRRSLQSISSKKEGKYDFIYVASGEPHKNHRQLVEAWTILASEGIFPVLCLTLNELYHCDLLEFISDKCKSYGLKIVNVGNITPSSINTLYQESKALIYPSTLESFGLPLVEARTSNLAVLASELDYVRDILDPEETFDPLSPKSIARAVKRFLGVLEKDLPMVDPKAFIEYCINLPQERH